MGAPGHGVEAKTCTCPSEPQNDTGLRRAHYHGVTLMGCQRQSTTYLCTAIPDLRHGTSPLGPYRHNGRTSHEATTPLHGLLPTRASPGDEDRGRQLPASRGGAGRRRTAREGQVQHRGWGKRLLGASGGPCAAALVWPQAPVSASQARQHIRDAFQCIEKLPQSTDARRTQLVDDALSALASASWWLDDWEAGLEDALSWIPGAGTPACRGADVSCPGNGGKA
jgi:hypothetical protein